MVVALLTDFKMLIGANESDFMEFEDTDRSQRSDILILLRQ